MTFIPLSSKGVSAPTPPSRRGALPPGSHSSGRHRAVQVAAASGRKQLRLKIGPDTGKKTPLSRPSRPRNSRAAKRDDPSREAPGQRVGPPGGSHGAALPTSRVAQQEHRPPLPQTSHPAASQHRSPPSTQSPSQLSVPSWEGAISQERHKQHCLPPGGMCPHPPSPPSELCIPGRAVTAPHGPHVPTCNCPASSCHCADKGYSVPQADAGRVWGQKKRPKPPSQGSSGCKDYEQHFPPVLLQVGGACAPPGSPTGGSQGFARHPGEKTWSVSSLHQGSAFGFGVKEDHRKKLLEGPAWYGVRLLHPTPQKVPSPTLGLPVPLGKAPHPVLTVPAVVGTGVLMHQGRTALLDQLRSQGQGRVG